GFDSLSPHFSLQALLEPLHSTANHEKTNTEDFIFGIFSKVSWLRKTTLSQETAISPGIT
ncbi:MAG TPA: hypothetical protein VKX46_19680, partial [Ktedonobacteraceae bacterium]|nr:hypothetical protein [Ktedonobacteraceae bacterium]